MTLRPLPEHHLEFLSLKGGCTGSSESTFVKIPLCWKSHVTAQMLELIDKKTILHSIFWFIFWLLTGLIFSNTLVSPSSKSSFSLLANTEATLIGISGTSLCTRLISSFTGNVQCYNIKLFVIIEVIIQFYQRMTKVATCGERVKNISTIFTAIKYIISFEKYFIFFF